MAAGNILRSSLVALLLGGCACYTAPHERLQCAPQPSLPLVMETELSGLSDSVYSRLVERELRLREYIELLKVGCDE